MNVDRLKSTLNELVRELDDHDPEDGHQSQRIGLLMASALEAFHGMKDWVHLAVAIVQPPEGDFVYTGRATRLGTSSIRIANGDSAFGAAMNALEHVVPRDATVPRNSSE